MTTLRGLGPATFDSRDPRVTKEEEAYTPIGVTVRTGAGKRYSITDRGMGLMDLVKKLYSQWH